MEGAGAALLPQEVCKSNLSPGFAESAGRYTRQEAGGGMLGEEQRPKSRAAGFTEGRAQRGAKGPLLPPAPPGSEPDTPGAPASLMFCGFLTQCLSAWGSWSKGSGAQG